MLSCLHVHCTPNSTLPMLLVILVVLIFIIVISIVVSFLLNVVGSNSFSTRIGVHHMVFFPASPSPINYRHSDINSWLK
jgi:hypothetical protein